MSTVYHVSKLTAPSLRRVAANVNQVTMTTNAEAIRGGVLVRGAESSLPQWLYEIRREARRINKTSTVRREGRRRPAGALSVRKKRRVAKKTKRLTGRPKNYSTCPRCRRKRVLLRDPYGGARLCKACRDYNEPFR